MMSIAQSESSDRFPMDVALTHSARTGHPGNLISALDAAFRSNALIDKPSKLRMQIDILDLASYHVAGARAEQLLGGGIEKGDAAVAIHGNNPIGCCRDHRLALTQFAPEVLHFPLEAPGGSLSFGHSALENR